ncbi:hypothetical protein PFICI_01647 [Pestalotiopsis fici W106-1]|uniref:Carboxylic ester hydrolase n=1 Tax=Pestalotiopsis fici (strain W106-1 / CGMCC3.15140) TaxID=1229662 RepID=W3XPC1_PESFW|nr:uncharacterized protein PFICI_01647 [Pestalotiopsis fici W106-1]ETS87819.1 hypothetical protein PFICI_01647 [Pestalotiopsis fici W106-1]
MQRASRAVFIALFSVALAALQVNLDYATYQGYYDSTYDLNIWKSVRYAAPPVGNLRWQAPRPPPTNRSAVIPATEQPPICPQTGGYALPAVYGFTSGYGDEDCLYLNVHASPNASSLPVMVWIHGGGYSKFGAVYDPSVWLNTNDNGFVFVEIQYRLGAFGYLSSPDIKNNGVLNAGLLDQRFALDWVQKYITKFGGDPTRVTIGGESSGAGSVMFHALAYGGNDAKVFNNIVAASPYTPPVYNYNDPVPTGNYQAFVDLVGCGRNAASAADGASTFACLVAADTLVLQNASGTVSTTRGYFGSFAFQPVVDGSYIQTRPSQQLLTGKVNGKRILVGNNANEGVPLTNPDVDTFSEYNDFIAKTYPRFTPADVISLNAFYQTAFAQQGDNGTRFDTLGDSGPTALTVSEFATGLQQAVLDIGAESVYDCPAQWLAEAFTPGALQAWKYQYSVTPAYHGHDLTAYFAVGATVPNLDFRYAFQKILGNFIVFNSPLISRQNATAGYANATAPPGAYGNIGWPEYGLINPTMINLNTTGGQLTEVVVTPNLTFYQRTGPGIVNRFRLVNSRTWEGGRGFRCDFWRSVSARVPY